jgi:hypothetical protein
MIIACERRSGCFGFASRLSLALATTFYSSRIGSRLMTFLTLAALISHRSSACRGDVRYLTRNQQPIVKLNQSANNSLQH